MQVSRIHFKLENSITKCQLPAWLDSYIYTSLGAKFCKSNSDMTVVDWDKSEVLKYLGTYFPRSYSEAKSIISEDILKPFYNQQEISILDFGCGTGGELIGLLSNIEDFLPAIKTVNITAIDGNQHALRLFEIILNEFKQRSRLEINCHIAPIVIGDFYDLSVLDEIITGSFDLIISFKAICEFVTKDQFTGKNPYQHIVETYLPHLTIEGLIVLVDITSYNNVSNEWLPKMMDKGLLNAKCIIVAQNTGYNQTYAVTHTKTRTSSDISKVCWRIVKRK